MALLAEDDVVMDDDTHGLCRSNNLFGHVDICGGEGVESPLG
jgi:hypothetical protein